MFDVIFLADLLAIYKSKLYSLQYLIQLLQFESVNTR